MEIPKVASRKTAKRVLLMTEVRKAPAELLRRNLYTPDEYRAERDLHAAAIRQVMETGRIHQELATRHMTMEEQQPC